jgi:homocitrate synthase NifV
MSKSSAIKKIKIIDTTLRDGEQAPGVRFTLKDKIRIAEMLAGAGVDEIEAGTPAMGDEVQKDIRALVRLGLPCRFSVWCRAMAKDIDSSRRCEAGDLHISFPVSKILLGVMDKDESWVLRELERLVPMARWDFHHVTVGAQDATRADAAFLGSFLNLAADAGASRVRIADTIGLSTPLEIHRLIMDLKKIRPDTDLEFHGHNDLGMATANSLSAAEAGAAALSVTVNGLGERSGNAPLEEVVQAIELSRNFKSSVVAEGLMSVCRFVAEASGRPIPAGKPITGSDVFTHESGIHCAGLVKDTLSYQPYAPEAVGREGSSFVLGSHSGSKIIRHLLAEAGINVSLEDAARFKEILSKQRVSPGLDR